ncbi:hypothetical protein BC834DRAFT_521251 [Gloeopeniophorella convolvens]|nr:hypothetical protein BC834DRAFT_521251 [Gloeopeniophorella convolvens]
MSRSTIYAFILLLCSSLYGCPSVVLAGQVNITVDDNDPSIIYQPAAWWFFSGNSSGCAFCLTPPSPTIAYKSTWHHGLHVIPTTDTDDTSEDDEDSDSHGSDKDSGKQKGGGGSGKRDADDSVYDPNNGATASPFTTAKLDSDDAGFVDHPVSVQLNFTGSAIYLYCILPLGLPPNPNSTPTFMNLSFTLDNQSAGSFLHTGAANTGGFQPNVSVFSRTGLADSAHTLLVNLGPDSVFLFDFYVFSQADGSNFGSPPASSPIISVPSQTPNTSDGSKQKKHDVATFAGAVGGSVGVLAIISACLAFSIYRRRRRSAHRQRHEMGSDAQSFHTDASEDGPPMQGPAPFVPRYFPGTVPIAPPPYIGPADDPLLPRISDTSSTTSYHHIPPPLPFTHRAPPSAALLATHDAEPLDIPPPFSVAVSSPVSPVLANVAPQSISRIPPPGFEEDEETEQTEVAPILPAEPLPPPPRHPRPSRPNSLRSTRSSTSASLREVTETLALRAESSGSETDDPLPPASDGHSAAHGA